MVMRTGTAPAGVCRRWRRNGRRAVNRLCEPSGWDHGNWRVVRYSRTMSSRACGSIAAFGDEALIMDNSTAIVACLF